MKLISKAFVGIGVLVAALGVVAQEKLIVPYPAGGPSDATARVIANSLSGAGENFIVENVSGATGMVAINRFLANPKEQVFQGTQNELILPVYLNKAAKFKSEDFVPVQYITQTFLVLAVKKDLPVKNLDEFIELAHKREKTPLSYGTVGVGSLYHIMGEYLAKKKGIRLNHVPYKGGAPAMQDLIGGQIDFSITPYQTTFDDMVNKGMFKVIAIFSEDKPATLKNLQSASSVAGLEDFNFASYAGYYLRKDASSDEKKKYNALFAKALNDEKVKTSLSADGRRVLPPVSLEQATKNYALEIEKYRKLLGTVGTISME